jgi:pyruvate-ferredoxin/flavodoxin oxidoreductase
MFYGLGADGTVGANKNSIKIIGEGTENFSQGYFVYDSKKAGAVTTSHLRFGKKPIRSTYLINEANFIACHQYLFLEKYDMLRTAVRGATFLLNAPYDAKVIWNKIPRKVQKDIIDKKLKFYVINAYDVAKATGMGSRINTIMQVCFFAISGVLPRKEAIKEIKDSIKKTYGSKGEEIVKRNFEAVDKTLENLHEVKVPAAVTSKIEIPPVVPAGAPDFVKQVTAKIIAGLGDDLPVSAFSKDGTFPSGTTQWEKRNIAMEIPVWAEDICIQCNKCIMVCPHSVIRAKVYDAKYAEKSPKTFKSAPARGKEWPDNSVYSLQVAPEDWTGCVLCVEVCPVKNKEKVGLKAINMKPQMPLRESERKNWDYFLTLPEVDRKSVNVDTVKGSQFLQPLFEFSGACAGCGETPYVKLVSQLFGDRMIVANATGCSSIYGGNLPTTPWTLNNDGRGPAWSNSLFEDNAEFGLGFRLTVDKHTEQAKELLQNMKSTIDGKLVDEVLNAEQSDEGGIFAQRERVKKLKDKLASHKDNNARLLLSLADYLVEKSVWIIGGDGWAYDIGYGGLDHVIASGRNVNILVLDTEVYSNTGGQMSKATPLGGVAKFAAAGKPNPKKDLAMQALSYGSVYVARIAMGASDVQTVKAFIEAEKYDGPSIIIAYSHCIAHGINMKNGLNQQKLAVDSGYWPLIRFNPELAKKGENPFRLDSKAPSIPLENYIYNETRFKMLTKSMPERAKMLLTRAQEEVNNRWKLYEKMVMMYDNKNVEI